MSRSRPTTGINHQREGERGGEDTQRERERERREETSGDISTPHTIQPTQEIVRSVWRPTIEARFHLYPWMDNPTNTFFN
jgi:hypothetical protein